MSLPIGHLEQRIERVEHTMEILEERQEKTFEWMHGNDDGEMGLTHKVSIMWKMMIIWPFCTISALAGCAITLLVQHFIK